MKSSLMRARWAAVGAAVAVSMGAGAVMVASAGPTGDSGFRAITPCRLLDTRTVANAGADITPLGIRFGKVGTGDSAVNDITVVFDATAKASGFDYTIEVSPGTYRSIMGACDARISADDVAGTINAADTITAVVLNVTVVESSAAATYVQLYPWQLDPATKPVFSNLNPSSGVSVVTNQVTVALQQLDGAATVGINPINLPGIRCSGGVHGTSDCSGLDAFRIFNKAGAAHIIIDVMGYHHSA